MIHNKRIQRKEEEDYQQYHRAEEDPSTWAFCYYTKSESEMMAALLCSPSINAVNSVVMIDEMTGIRPREKELLTQSFCYESRTCSR
jgi:hypothetical protein